MTQKLSLSEELAYNTVRIESETSSGKHSVGTGFFFHFEVTSGKIIPVVITNKHVVADAKRGTFHLTRAGSDGLPIVGQFETIVLDDFDRNWIPHPQTDVDLCAMPVAPLLNQAQQQGLTFFHRSFNKTLIANSSLLADLTALEEILMIGYPVGIWDSKNNMPIFRSGITATHPNIDYNGKTEFMIDCACFPGSSGSPVLLYNFGNYHDRAGNTVIGTRLALLGILYAGPQFTVEGKIIVSPIPTQLESVPISRIPTNLGMVIKAQRILEFEPLLQRLAGGT